jgi:hypothetical protein
MENIQKPKNNLALTIVGTVLFWPISLWGLLKAVKVNRLWESGNHQEAIDASNSARKLGIAGIIVGGIFSVIVFIVSDNSAIRDKDQGAADSAVHLFVYYCFCDD